MAEQLSAEGWAVLDRNWRCEAGELDLVVERAGAVRVVEVKARAPGDPSGLDAVDRSKRRRLRSAAEAWLDARGAPNREIAFLLVVVTGGDEGSFAADWFDDPF